MSPDHNSASNFNEAPADRERKRFIRRWKRRIRTLGPFLGIPLVFCTLALSMGLINYLPNAHTAKAQARSVQSRPIAELTRSAERRARIPSKPLAAARHGGAVAPTAASINGLDPKSISLERSNTREARVP